MSAPTGSARVAIVTGAARGIGAAAARRLAQDGLAVAVIDLAEVEHRDGEAVGGQPLRGGRADPPGGAGDDRDAGALRRGHEPTHSNTAARPWPPPMHIVSRP